MTPTRYIFADISALKRDMELHIRNSDVPVKIRELLSPVDPKKLAGILSRQGEESRFWGIYNKEELVGSFPTAGWELSASGLSSNHTLACLLQANLVNGIAQAGEKTLVVAGGEYIPFSLALFDVLEEYLALGWRVEFDCFKKDGCDVARTSSLAAKYPTRFQSVFLGEVIKNENFLAIQQPSTGSPGKKIESHSSSKKLQQLQEAVDGQKQSVDRRLKKMHGQLYLISKQNEELLHRQQNTEEEVVRVALWVVGGILIVLLVVGFVGGLCGLVLQNQNEPNPTLEQQRARLVFGRAGIWW